MSPDLAEMIVTGAGLYLAAGAIFGLLFVTLLVKRSAAGARAAAPIQLRILILPASAVLWPYVLIRGLIGGANGEERDETSA